MTTTLNETNITEKFNEALKSTWQKQSPEVFYKKMCS